MSAGTVGRGPGGGLPSAELSHRLRLPTFVPALIRLGKVHALAGRREEMEAVIADARATAGPDDPELGVGLWGRIHAIEALRQADDRRAREALGRAMEILRDSPSIPFVHGGLWALLCNVHEVGGVAARDEVRASGTLAVRWNRCCLGYADAVAPAEQVAATRRSLRSPPLMSSCASTARLTGDATRSGGWSPRRPSGMGGVSRSHGCTRPWPGSRPMGTPVPRRTAGPC